ncbi:uncharacterized protein LOC107610322 [Arachis ipaensis]|uniref:uncharacterized protein LOC107610322 n=1 Tax=Arachis ipaensis TaxID=130454 RepID=UPI000A2B56E1|nr:uncharacterized protein LOC107610322 [Arachis ipaensis]
MAGEKSFVVLVHHRGSIKRKIRSGVKFTDKDPLSIFMRPTTRYDEFVNSILRKLGLQGVKRVLFHCRRQFSEVRTPELLAKLVDVVSSSGGSNRNTQTIGTVAGSSSRPVGASLSVPVNEPPGKPVASPSFAVDLNCSGGGEVGIVDRVPTSLQCAAPAGMGDALLDDVDDDNVEPDLIGDDSGDEIAASNPAGAGGGSSSGTQQYPPHFLSLDLDAMRQEGVPGEPTGFGARDAQGTGGLTEFQDKDEAVLSVKTYSIRRGVQYKVVESDYRRYVGKCSEFGNGYTWLIRLCLRQRKGIWEVKRYNGPHTCLATSISSDHRSLDYHVISAFIMPMVRADASINIKVLLNATAAHFGSRSTYKRV